MSPKLSLALFLCLIAASGSSFGAQSQCKYADQRQQQACQQAEAQRQQQLQQQQAQQRQQQEAQRQAQLRQQQEAQRQQQLQQQQALQQQREQQAQQQRAKEQARQAETQRQQQLQQQQALQRQQEQQAQQRAQEQARQAEAQRQKAQEAQRQQQLQQQPTPVLATAKPNATPTPVTSPTVGMTPVVLGNGQRIFVNSQGAFFDANANPISDQDVANAKKGTAAIASTPAPQVAPPKPASTGTVGSANSRAQEQARQDEAQRQQQQEAQRQEQLQQQQALQRQQEQQRPKPALTTAKPTAPPMPVVSRTEGMAPVALGNGQQVFVNSQGAFFDASGNPISNQSVATATKGTPAIASTPAPQVVPPKPAPTVTPTGTIVPASARLQSSPSPSPAPQVAVPMPAVTTVKPSVAPTPATSRTAGLTPVTLGNGQQVFVNAQGAFFDANGNPISNQSVATATKGTPAITITPTPAPAPMPSAPIGSAASRLQSGAKPTAGPPSTQELERYGVEQLAAMPKEQLVNLSPDKRHHLDVYLSAKADAAKYQTEANRSLSSRFVEELPRQTARAAEGVVDGGQSGATNYLQGTAAFGGQIVDPNTYKAAANEVRDLVTDPGVRTQDAKILQQAGVAVLGSAKDAASKFAADVAKGDARAASKDVVEPVTEFIADVATGKLVSRGAKIIAKTAEGVSGASIPLKSEVGSATSRFGKQAISAGPVNFMGNGDQFLKYVNKRTDIDSNGSFDVVAHGSTQQIQVMTATGPVLTDHRTAARLIRNTPGYTGQPVRLLACNTGACDAGFAQNLANKMGIPVQAPTTLLWAYNDGRMVVAPRMSPDSTSSLFNVPDLSNQGAFRTFTPTKP